MHNINKLILLFCFVFNVQLLGMKGADEISKLSNLESQIRGEVEETRGNHQWYSALLDNDRLIKVAKRVAGQGYPTYIGNLEINRSTARPRLLELPQEKLSEYYSILEAKYKKQSK